MKTKEEVRFDCVKLALASYGARSPENMEEVIDRAIDILIFIETEFDDESCPECGE